MSFCLFGEVSGEALVLLPEGEMECGTVGHETWLPRSLRLEYRMDLVVGLGVAWDDRARATTSIYHSRAWSLATSTCLLRLELIDLITLHHHVFFVVPVS